MKLRLEKEINASADKVWGVLAHQFAEIGEWAPHIEYSRIIEDSEVPTHFKVADSAPVPGRATPNPLGEVTEVLTMYSENDKAFTFEADGPRPIFNHTQNTTHVIDQGADKCLVTFDLELMPKGVFKLFKPVLERRFKTSVFGPAGVINDLKDYVETNSV